MENLHDQIEKEFAEAIAWAKAEGYSVEHISHYPRMSEETNAFAADIYKNGKRMGGATNDGRGGSDRIDSRNHLGPDEYKKLEMFIDSMVDKHVNDKTAAAFENRAKRNAQKNNMNLAIIRSGKELAAQTTTEPTEEAFRIKHPQQDYAAVEFFVFRTEAGAKAAQEARNAACIARWKKQAAKMGKNLVIGSKGGIPMTGYFTPAKDIEEFMQRNPKAIATGFDITFNKIV